MADGTVPPTPPESRRPRRSAGQSVVTASGPGKKSGKAGVRRGERPQRGIQSAEMACRILKAIASFDGEITLSALSAHLGMLPGNVHRYLASLQFEGFVKQERVSGEYDLGPAALALGTRAMRRLDNQEVAFQETRALSKEIDASVWLSVWTENIPVVVAVHDRGAIGPLTARLGTRVRATYSAQGRVFLAYREQALTDAMWKLEYDKEEPPRSEGQVLDLPRFQKLLQTIRERGGLSRVRGDMTKGISAMASPVFDMWGNVIFVVTAVGHTHELNVGWGSKTAVELVKTTKRISEKLGFTGHARIPQGAA
jgi:DNA-binding IclR family transcriptional regulator